jgi:hypothetical protein
MSATLKHIRGMAGASSVPVLQADALSEVIFVSEYVSRSLPCVIKGAVRRWDALEKWRDKEYVKARSGHHSVNYFPHEYHVTSKRNDVGQETLTFANALDRLHSCKTKMAIVATVLPTELQSDTGGFSFLSRTEPAFCYTDVRYFFYRNAGTTWHYHPFDETLMCQIIGSKRIGLLNANTHHQIRLRNLFFQEDYYDDPTVFDAFGNADLRWFSATLNEGDALYIPPLWWHGVTPIDEEFGATVAVTWRSPPHVIAYAIKKMASGHVDMIGKTEMTRYQDLVDIAAKMGLEKELAIARQRGV